MSEELLNPIQEQFWYDLTYEEEIINEATGETRMKIHGVVQEADSVNRNKRMYPRDVLDEAVNALLPKIRKGQVFGEADHPDFRGSLKLTSHLVSDLWWSEDKGKQNQLMGEMLVLNTPSGNILKEIVRAGGRPGFSSRGRGDSEKVKVPGHGEVDKILKGFRLESFDFVIDPSVKSAEIIKIIEDFKKMGKQKACYPPLLKRKKNSKKKYIIPKRFLKTYS